eukprot:scaffold300_cov258-Pinguiococcus_pyrenoidosus.AAC.69
MDHRRGLPYDALELRGVLLSEHRVRQDARDAILGHRDRAAAKPKAERGPADAKLLEGRLVGRQIPQALGREDLLAFRWGSAPGKPTRRAKRHLCHWSHAQAPRWAQTTACAGASRRGYPCPSSPLSPQRTASRPLAPSSASRWVSYECGRMQTQIVGWALGATRRPARRPACPPLQPRRPVRDCGPSTLIEASSLLPPDLCLPIPPSQLHPSAPPACSVPLPSAVPLHQESQADSSPASGPLLAQAR